MEFFSWPFKWTSHADLSIIRNESVNREEYLDHMTFQTNQRPLFTEIFGPLLGLKEEWEAQGATRQNWISLPFSSAARNGMALQ